jgi:hypothetical protein
MAGEKEVRRPCKQSLVNQQSDGLRALPVNGADPGIDAYMREGQSEKAPKMPFTGGYAGLKISDDLLGDQLKRAQIQKALTEPTARATGVHGFAQPPYTPPEGTIWNGHQFVRDPAYVRPSSGRSAGDTLKKIDSDVSNATGYHLSDWENAPKPGQFMVDDQGNPVDPAKATGYQVKTAEGKTIRTGLAGYQALLKAQERAKALGGAPQTELPDNGPVQAAPDNSAPKANEVTRKTKDGKLAVFDATTKQFLRYAQ